MHQSLPLRPQLLLAAGVLTAVFASASASTTLAQSLPPMQPTTLQPQPPGTPAASAPSPNPAHHAEIIFANGQLQVRADNSSLNQILRSISHRTGLTITGGVEDQRVFGNYGPGSISSVLATLLDGTGTNMLLLAGDAQSPPELQLTPRNGGVSPPGPNSEAYAMYDDSVDKQPPVPPPPSLSSIVATEPAAHGLAASTTLSQPSNASSVSASHPASAVSSPPLPNAAPTPAAPATSNAKATTVPATSGAAASATPQHLTPEFVMQELLKIQAQKKLQQQQMTQQTGKKQPQPQPTKPRPQQPQTPTSSIPQP